MADVVRWVDLQEVGDVSDILEPAGVSEALEAAPCLVVPDERTRSSVYTTAETVLAPFAASGVAAPSIRGSIGRPPRRVTPRTSRRRTTNVGARLSPL